MKRIKVVIADDHRYVMEGVEMALDDYDMDVVAKFESISELEQNLVVTEADVLLLDIAFGGSETGVQFAKRLLSGNPKASKNQQLKVIIFSQYEEPEIIKNSFEAGVKGFLSKSSSPDELSRAIHAVHAGELYLPDGIARRIAVNTVTSTSKARPNPGDILTEREYKIFLMVAEGKTQNEIGDELDMTVRTVANHVARIKEKLQVERPAQLTMIAVKQGLISDI